jgi:uncharacterized protein (DUF1697 family)
VVLLPRAAKGGLAEHLERDFASRFGRKPSVFIFQSDAGPREYA